MESLSDLIQLLKNPLLFICRTGFKKVDSVKDLDTTISLLVDRTLSLKLTEEQVELLNELRGKFSEFPNHDLDAKKRIIQESLEIIDKIDSPELSSGIEEPQGVLSSFAERKQVLATGIQYVKGVGPRIAALLKRKGIVTIEDALFYLPRSYEDRRNIKPISRAVPGNRETLRGRILGLGVVSYGRRRIFEMVIGDESGTVIAKWFNFNEAYLSHLKRRYSKGETVVISGKIEAFRYQREVLHPDIEVIKEDGDESLHFKRIVPKYSEAEGLHQKTIRRIMKNVVDRYGCEIPDAVPRSISERLGLPDVAVAFERIHFPKNEDDFDRLVDGRSAYHRRIIFDEFFFLELGLALRKRGLVLGKGIAFRVNNNIPERLENLIGFSLTGAQRRVIGEIADDMAKPHPMNRLIQGDVGSGKTVVAFAAALVAAENDYQAAFMAPTEILAEQHFATLRPLAEGFGLSMALLTSNMNSTRRREVYPKINAGEINVVVGTHAIIQEGVGFSKLGLGIIDEQHRFGVVQRASLKKKGINPDILVMTATPIPRTLAMTVYGDLDVSIIDEMPPGRLPVRTQVYHERQRKRVYEIVADEISRGFQAFIVYPLIEESETVDLMNATTMYEHLQKDVFPDYCLALLHGRMKGEEKEAVMQSFKQGSVQILVSTTVIEVGIDVPRATLMVIEHAERFGLSQLHQLRGRVGRGEHSSQCILLAQFKKSDEARKRLEIMEETNDGFRIAEEDLAIRGPGDFFGVRQSGLPDFRVANIIRDAKVLNEARREAFDLVSKDPLLQDPKHHFMKESLKQRWKGRLQLAGIG
ncbi:MAG: ATP-dependent DNA helicase RecG [Deltaproteobacteria bacterium]|nr:ATP-dependent DNA helicase RecG [Deltaproteobacteria bacterium]